MGESDDRERALFEQFKELYSQARSEEGTGDTSLDMLLRGVEPSFAQIIETLAVPHWFNVDVVAALEGPVLAARTPNILREMTELPFVRSHPRGLAYHDMVREALRRYLARKDRGRLQDLSHRFTEIFARQRQRDGAEESNWERVYHTLGYNEAEGFEAFDALFMEARHNRRFTVCDTLVHMAAEQQLLLSPQGTSRIDYYRGLLAFDLHRWDDAEILFQGLSATELPPPLAGRVQFYGGRILEAKGMWQDAEQVYQAYLKSRGHLDGDPALSARFHQRLAETYLCLGDLKRAEAHAGTSLKINQRSGDQFGAACNFETLGGIFGKLRDLARAQAAFEKSLAILDKVGRHFDKARIYSDLAALYLSFDKWTDAEHYYQSAVQVKVDAGDNYGLAFIYSNLGQLYLKRGDSEAARRHFHTSLTIFQQFKDSLNAAKVLRHLAIVHERLNDIPSALDHMRKAEQQLPRDSSLVPVYQDEIRRFEQLRPGEGSAKATIAMVIGIVATVIVFLVLLLLPVLTVGED